VKTEAIDVLVQEDWLTTRLNRMPVSASPSMKGVGPMVDP
jgi:hypothetical protein